MKWTVHWQQISAQMDFEMKQICDTKKNLDFEGAAEEDQQKRRRTFWN